jgi:multiple sugar transport system substrate-binding protein
LVGGGSAVAASAAFLSGAWHPRRTYASQPAGDITVRIFPFGVGVEELYQAFADEFQTEYPETTVNIDLQPWDGRYPKMLADLAAGQGPDVMFITTDVLIRFAEANAIIPLDDALPAAAWEGYNDTQIEEISFDGMRWFAPADREVPLWLINKGVFEQVGLNPEELPSTWDDIRALSTQVKEANDPMLFGWGYSAGSSTLNTTFYPYLYQAGGRPISEDGSEPTFNSEAGVAALSLIVEGFSDGWIPPQYMQPIQSSDQDPFFLGMQALSDQYFAKDLIDLRQAAPDLEYALTPMLRNKETWGFGGMRSWALSQDSQNPEAAAAFLEFLIRPENQLRHGEAFGTFPQKEQAIAEAFADDEELASLRDHLEYTFGEQKHKYGRDLMPLVTPEIQAAILGEKDPQQALDDAAAAVSELFAQG